MYSLTEVDTGKKWINGETIYRRCFNTGTLQPNSVTYLDTSLTAIIPISYGGYFWSSSTLVGMLPSANVTSLGYQIQVQQSRVDGPTVITGTGFTASVYGVVWIEYIKA